MASKPTLLPATCGNYSPRSEIRSIEMRAAALYVGGWRLRDVARETGLTISRASSLFNRLGIVRPRGRRPQPQAYAWEQQDTQLLVSIARLRRRRATVAAVCAELAITRHTYYTLRRQVGDAGAKFFNKGHV